MTTEKHSVEEKPKDAIDIDMKFERVPQISSCEVESQENKDGNDVPRVRLHFSDERHDKDLDEKVQRLNEEEEEQHNNFCVDGIVGLVSEEKSNWLQSCSFIIKLSIGIYVMAQTVHDLPFIMSEPS